MLSARAVRIDTDGPAFSAKTPGRDLKSRLENANSIATTVRRKGKNALYPKTPLHPSSAQSKRLFKDQKLVLGTAPRPKLGDKTPLPNRTLIPQSPSEKVKASKVSSLYVTTLPDSLIDDGDTDVLESMKRPSSLRKHLKLPTNSTQKNFETPMNHGRHWELSDGDIDVSGLQPELQEMKIVEDDIGSDEIEYSAPNTLDLPYRPPFDFELPDYKEVGRNIRELAFSIPFDDAPGPLEREFLVNELELIAWETFPLPPLESEDPFSLARLESKLHKTTTRKPLQQTDSLSHRRVQSSLAHLGSASSSINRFKNTAPSANSRVLIPPKQPPKPSSDLQSRTSKLAATSKTVKPTTIQKRTMASAVQQSHTANGGPIRSRTRPHTSLSLASMSKGTTLAPKRNNPPIYDHHVVDELEDFMFDV